MNLSLNTIARSKRLNVGYKQTMVAWFWRRHHNISDNSLSFYKNTKTNWKSELE